MYRNSYVNKKNADTLRQIQIFNDTKSHGNKNIGNLLMTELDNKGGTLERQ